MASGDGMPGGLTGKGRAACLPVSDFLKEERLGAGIERRFVRPDPAHLWDLAAKPTD